jgi:sulfide:quinone oxidoreductase
MRGERSIRVVVIGGGVAALELVLALKQLGDDRLDIRVVAPEREFVYRPLAVAEPFGLATARRFNLDRLLADHGAARHEAVIERVDPGLHVAVTAGGSALEYDVLVATPGARPFEAIPAALTVGVGDGFARLGPALKQLEAGRQVVVAIPVGISWTLPAYELAFLTGVAHPHLRVALVTPEEIPLAVFGRTASDAVAALLNERGLGFHPGSHAIAVDGPQLRLLRAAPISADLVVAMPGLRGPRLAGLPQDSNGFIPVDKSCRVVGVEDVYAAGDATTFPIKQGGLAAQQAVVVAQAIAHEMGIPAPAAEFKPVLRGLLLTGGLPEYLRADIARGKGVYASEAELDPIWWPPSKIATEHLSQLLALIAVGEPLPAEDPFMRIETDDVGDLLRPN